jgi:DNA polymerase III delta prime subunit
MLRAFIEEFSRQCGFIFTANHPARIIPPLHSRCSLVDFRIPAKQRQGIAITFAKRVMKILTDEKVVFDQKVVLGAVQMYFPDFRRTLNELQRFSSSGTLSEAILSQMSDNEITELVAALKSREYDPIFKWVTAHPDIDEFAFYHMLLDKLLPKVEPDSLTTVILLAHDYSYKAALAADKQLNVLACLRELQVEGRFK